MFIRATRVETPPDKMAQAVANFEEQVIPSARSAPGYLGAALLADPMSGGGIGLTYWESAKALTASEHVGVQTRVQAAKNVPGTQIVNVERYEVVIMDRGAPPKSGVFARVNTFAGDPAKIDALTVFIRNSVLPVVKALKGYRLATMAVDRQTGRSVVSTVWETLDDQEASNSKVAGLREEATRIAGGGAGSVQVEIFEVSAVEMTQAALALSGS